MFNLNNTSDDIGYQNGREYVIEASGGDVAVERYLLDGTTTTAVEGSPILDGESKFLVTESHPKANADGTYPKTFLKMTTTADVDISFYPTTR